MKRRNITYVYVGLKNISDNPNSNFFFAAIHRISQLFCNIFVRYQHVYHHHPTSTRRSLSTSGGGNDGLHYGGSGSGSHHYTPSSITGSGSYMLPHHYNYQQHYSSQHHPHTSSDIGTSGGKTQSSNIIKLVTLNEQSYCN